MLLSICIPSYNRIHKIYPMILSLLTLKSNQFEIVVIDNCSTQDVSPLQSIIDPRFRLIIRNEPVCGTQSVNECIKFGKGKFSLICIDKDVIDYRFLNRFLDCLEKHQYVCGGICSQNHYEIQGGVSVITKNPILKFGYRTKHPTGNFYKNDIIKNFFLNIDNSTLLDPFCYDFLGAECSIIGSMMNYNYSLVFLEKIDDAKKIRTHTFRKEDGTLFFFPQNRIVEYRKQLKHLRNLPLNLSLKRKVSITIYKRTFYSVTFDYKEIMKEFWLCEHYNLESRNVSYAEMKEYIKELNKCFFKADCILNSLSKFIVISYFLMIFNFKSIFSKIRSFVNSILNKNSI